MSANEWITLLGLGVALIVGAAGLGWLLLGLFRARSLVRRELSAYFLSPIAYVLFAVFLVLTGYLFSNAVRLLTETGPVGVELPTRLMFGDPYFWLVFLFIPPVLTMRSFAEERSTGTFESLMTAPLRALYLGVMLAGAMFLGIGLFISSLVRDQLVAALISLAIGLVFTLAGFLQPELDSGGVFDRVVYFISVPLHFARSFTRGLLDTRPLILYASVAAFFLLLTVRSLESKR